MSTVPRYTSFADRHEVAPGRFSHVFEFVALGAILAGDAVAFQQIVAVAMAESPTWVTWTLIVALSAAATVSMHLAGVSARRRKAGVHQAGRPWSICLILGWLGLGGMALWFRLAEAQVSESADTSGGVFGAATATGAGTAVPLAFMMLALYLVGGITAYGIGYGMHNPARSAYRRAEREHRRASRAYRWAAWRHKRALARFAPATRGPVSQRGSSAETPRPRPTVAPSPPLSRTDVPAAGTPDPQDELAARREVAIARARAQAHQLRQVARHRLASALAEPARTSGVFDGHPLPAAVSHLPGPTHRLSDIDTMQGVRP